MLLLGSLLLFHRGWFANTSKRQLVGVRTSLIDVLPLLALPGGTSIGGNSRGMLRPIYIVFNISRL